MNALEAEGLNTYYGKSHILHNVGLTVAEGRVTTLLGRNGAGKTTTLRSLVGLTPPRTGHVRLFGRDTTGLPPFRIARAVSAMCRKAAGSSPTSPSRKTSRCRSNGLGPGTSPEVYELFPRLMERRDNRGRQLSGGEQEMLSIARALLLNPRLLILDEPSRVSRR